MKLNKIALIAILALGSIFTIEAQTRSPYSKFGFGLLNDNASSAQRAMGGVGYAMNSGRQINVMNPASYAAIDSLTFLFDMGLDMNMSWSSEYDANGDKVHGSNVGGGIDYITMQFPVTRYMGMSIGLLPYSTVGYSFGSEIANGSSAREGTGGINQLYAGLSVTPFKNAYIGANFGFLWGTIVNSAYGYTDSGATSLFERVMKVRDFNMQFGIQYAIDFSKQDRMVIGAVYSPAKKLHGKTWGSYYDIDQDTKADSIGITSLKDAFSLPETWGGGISYQHKGFMVEADYTYQPWSKAKSGAIENNGEIVYEQAEYSDRWKASLGFQYRPKSRGSYFELVNYRLGAYYNHGYVKSQGNNICDYGITLGFGLPVPKNKTMINLGFEYMRREANPNPLITEDYFNITLGVNFNEMWFWKNKIR